MQVKEYHRKYLGDIKSRKPITPKELLMQIREDYMVIDPSDRDYANANLPELERRIAECIKNRLYEEVEVTRIANEYYWRNRIAYLFPMAHRVLAAKWNDEQRDEMMQTQEYKDFVRHNEERRTGVKPKSEVENIFGKLVTRVGGDK